MFYYITVEIMYRNGSVFYVFYVLLFYYKVHLKKIILPLLNLYIEQNC